MSDHALTMRDVPRLAWAGDEWPLFFSIRGQSSWAEHLGQTLDDILRQGFPMEALIGDGIAVFLRLALAGGDARRVAADGGEPRDTSVVADAMLDALSQTDLMLPLMQAWNWPPVDPQQPTPAADETGA